MRGIYIRRRIRNNGFPYNGGDNFSFRPQKPLLLIPLSPTLSNIREKFHYYLHVWMILAMAFITAVSYFIFTHFDARCHCNLSGNEVKAAANRHAMIGHNWGKAKIVVDGWLAGSWALAAGWPTMFLLCEIVRGIDMLWCWYRARRTLRSRRRPGAGIEKDVEVGEDCPLLAGKEDDTVEMPGEKLSVPCESDSRPAHNQPAGAATRSEAHNVLVDQLDSGTKRISQPSGRISDDTASEKSSPAGVTVKIQYWWEADDPSDFVEEEWRFPGWTQFTDDLVDQRFNGTTIYMRYPPEALCR
ncbi:uncharacterized protein AB675_11271 [Cyphellophora attinorum]|uniref:Uncharacterized protein n=1 Tax=Cyphellophora attinorum TaxID=1664694 RepID=A0A0N1P137_9EURO|nr:uncharacterized protein AB675_11271 [Phialophora attinorum]KPI40073.1 hypothetical protein AB675_11271 [Phialophora attinorum]